MKDVVNPQVPWSGTGHRYTQEEIDLVADLMRTADPFTQGCYQAEFEEKFAKYHGVQRSFALSSCTAALELSAILCKLKPGDEVILPAHTFAATAIPFARTGAKLVWADIDPKTFVVSADTIKPLITPKTKVIVVVHLYGLTAQMQPIVKLAREKSLLLVEDAAQVLGGKVDDQLAGTFGDFSCFSFHSHKNMTTLGEGGMLLVRDPQLASAVPGLRHNGTKRYPDSRECYWIPAMGDVDFSLDSVWPYNFCIGEIQCGLGSKLLERIDSINRHRHERGRSIIERLTEHPELEFQHVPRNVEHVYHLLPLRYRSGKPGVNRDDLIRTLAGEHGVKAVVQYYPLYRYPLFVKAGFSQANCPETDQYFDNMLSLPFQEWLTDEQVDYMVRAVSESVKKLRNK